MPLTDPFAEIPFKNRSSSTTLTNGSLHTATIQLPKTSAGLLQNQVQHLAWTG